MSINANGEHSIKYLDVYNELKKAIIGGKYLKGSFLPTEGKLTEIFNVSRTTIRKAVAMLQEDGLVSVQQGRGTEVTGGSEQLFPGGYLVYSNISGVKSRYSLEGEALSLACTIDTVGAPPKVASALNLPTGTTVYRVQRIRVINDTPIKYIVSYVPMDIAPGLEKFSGQPFALPERIREHYGIVHTSLEEIISAANAGFLESNLLNVPVGASLLVTCRIVLDQNGVIEYSESYCRPDLYQISISMKNSDLKEQDA